MAGPESGRARRLARPLILLLIFAAALGLRLLYLSQIEGDVLYLHPVLDSENYQRKALQILAGEETAPGVLTYNPLYPVILSLLYRLTGAPDLQILRLVQAVLGSLLAVMIAILGERLFDRRTALLAAVAAAVYGPFLFFGGEVIQSVWVLAALTGAFLLLPLDAGPRRWSATARALPAGLLFGVALLGRPNLLLFLPFL